MRIKKLELKNFRGFEDLTIDFPEGESGLAVFVGVNGSGKTSVLEGVAFMLQEFISNAFGMAINNPISISTLDINVNSTSTTFKIEAEDINISTISWSKKSWQYIKDFKGERRSKELELASDGIQHLLTTDEKINLPILAYYRTQRVFNDTPTELTRLISQQLETYIDAFDVKINFRNFVNWFIEQTNIENRLKVEKRSFQITNIKLDVVRRATNRFLEELPNTNFYDLRVGESKLTSKLNKKQTLLLFKNDKLFELNQLSEGEKIILLLVFDISYRLAVANPSMVDARHGNGVVLIDEIDLHLHPAWQRVVINALRRTFPNIQFILTTHSPQVLSNVPRENVFILKDFKLQPNKPHTEGRDSNAILEDIFEVPSRPEEEKNKLDALFDAIENGEKEKAQKLYDELKRKLGDRDLELQRAENYMDVLID